MKYCPKCGHLNPDTGLFCSECGSSLENKADNSFNKETESSSQQTTNPFNMNTDYNNQNPSGTQQYNNPDSSSGDYGYNNQNNNGYDGYNSQPYSPYSYNPNPNNFNNQNTSSDGKVIAGLVLGIVSVVFSFCCCCYFISALGGIIGIVGLVLSIMAKKDNPSDGKCTAAIILSAIGIVLGIFMTIYSVYTFANAANNPYWNDLFRAYGYNSYSYYN